MKRVTADILYRICMNRTEGEDKEVVDKLEEHGWLINGRLGYRLEDWYRKTASILRVINNELGDNA